jgi:uncharacterized protein (UPF0335 family)
MRNAFVEWRYLHERDPSGGIEFPQLIFAIELFHSVCQKHPRYHFGRCARAITHGGPIARAALDRLPLSIACNSITCNKAAPRLCVNALAFLCVHFHDLIQQRGTMSDISIPGGRIRSFVERIEHIDTELQELNESKKEVFSEAKAEGFDVKILKEIVKLRKQDKDERDERDTLLDMYMRAMETAGPELAAKAA